MKWRRPEEIIGKEVINSDANKLGVTKDLAWSSDGHLAVVIESDEEGESFLSFDDIEKIGDVVLVKAKSAQTILDRPTKSARQTKTGRYQFPTVGDAGKSQRPHSCYVNEEMLRDYGKNCQQNFDHLKTYGRDGFYLRAQIESGKCLNLM